MKLLLGNSFIKGHRIEYKYNSSFIDSVKLQFKQKTKYCNKKMLNFLTLLSIISDFFNGMDSLFNEKRKDPAPLRFNFSVDRNTNLTAQMARCNKRGTYLEVISYNGDISYRLNLLLGSNQKMNNMAIDIGCSDFWVTTDTYNLFDS